MCVYIYIYIYTHTGFSFLNMSNYIDKHFICTYSIFDQFKSSYESFDFSME